MTWRKSVPWGHSCSTWTDRQIWCHMNRQTDMMKLITDFPCSANAPKNNFPLLVIKAHRSETQLHTFLTFVLDCPTWLIYALAAWLLGRKKTPLPTEWGTEWVTEPVCALRRKISVVAIGIQNLDAPTYGLIAIPTMLTRHQYFTPLLIITTELVLVDHTVKKKISSCYS